MTTTITNNPPSWAKDVPKLEPIIEYISDQDGRYVRIYDWKQLADDYRAAVTGEATGFKLHGGEYAASWSQQYASGKGDRKGSWSGGNGFDGIRYLDKGYDLKASHIDLPAVDEANRPRWIFTDDDGEYDHSLFLNGDTEYYLHREPRKSLAGITVEAMFCFSAGTDAKHLATYGQWLGGVIASLQAQGFDMNLDLYMPLQGLYPGAEGVTETRIRIAKFGEVVMPDIYSPMFSGLGFRHYGFWALCANERRTGNRTDSGLGRPTNYGGTPWSVNFDYDRRVLRIEHPSMVSSVPVDDLNAQLRDIQATL